MKLTSEELVEKFPALVECDRYKANGNICEECLMYECIKVAQQEFNRTGRVQSRSDVLRLYMDLKFGDEYGILELLFSCALLEHVGSTLLEMLAIERAKWN